MNLVFRYILLIACCFSTLHSYSQKPKKIKIEYSGFTVKDSLKGENITTFVRSDQAQIHIVHDGVDMWCDKAIYYQNEDFIEAFSDVIVKQGDTINMTSKYVEYSAITKMAFAAGDVVLTEPQSVLTTDTLYFDRTKQEAYYRTTGKVVRDSSGTITSQVGRYYMNNSKYRFLKDVVLVNPEYTLNTNQLDFYSDTGHSYLYGPSTIVGDSSKIYCERGFYNTNNDTGYFLKNSKINYNNREVIGDSLYFDRSRSFASATNNIVVTDTINKSIIKGHYAEVFRAKDSVFITKRALAITVQEKDSIYIHADTLMITGKPEHRITRAFYNAKMYKSDMSGKADSIHADHKSGLTQLINLKRFSTGDDYAIERKPVIWNLGNQMTGDSIHLISNVVKEELDTLKVFNNAFIISKDTIGDGFNQIKGQRLIGLFENNELNNIDIIKNAEIIFYSRNDEDSLIGINKSKSAKINMKFEEGYKIVTLFNQVDGEIYPESDFPENARKFRGFDWREEERPNSIEDLFSDDTPFELPIIKGLDDSIPEEEFFDEAMFQRMDSAREKDSDDINKAERNLPKSTKQIKAKRDAVKDQKLPKPLINKTKKEN
ncbi:OstA-like protein [Psychroserpens ponticola]|uniref:OstA-like protein n=1 Tax=Psychroserpens ponticola TaxID=2932268 RepID=A0ABY7RYG8_9FLAO|nr:OstA-like protein [Psychroserpens ponticola]WCO00750.1 OstA-like protein [Psychroserpens ponticola]